MGRVAPRMNADLVPLGANPAHDVSYLHLINVVAHGAIIIPRPISTR